MVAMSDEEKDLRDAICEYVKALEPQVPATLIQGDQVVATGKATLGTPQTLPAFWPVGGKQLDIPDRATTLKLKDRPNAIPISDLEWCPGTFHFHFSIQQGS